MKNERKRLILFWLSFYSLFGAWKIVGILIVVRVKRDKRSFEPFSCLDLVLER